MIQIPYMTGVPTGTVDFLDGSIDLGSGTLDSSGNASLTISNLAGGTHTDIIAVYEGDATYVGSVSAAFDHEVDRVMSMSMDLSIDSSANPAVYSQPITLSVSVSASTVTQGMVAPTGTVEFYDGGLNLGSATLGGSGTAGWTVSNLAVGQHCITASYSGNINYDTAWSQTFWQTVEMATTTTISSSSPNPSTFGQMVDLTATVAAVSPGADTPSGMVTFYDGTTCMQLGSVVLDDSGSATLPVSALAAGEHYITATYDGDGSFAGSSSSISQGVQMATTTTVASPSSNPSTYGQSITFTATVAAVSPGSGTPTGSVTFYDGTTALGSATLNNSGIATLSTSALTVSSDWITALYGGDTDFTNSSSAVIDQVVDPGTPTVTVGSSANPSSFCRSITLTASVVGPAGLSTPTGTVEFYDGTTPLGQAALDSSGSVSWPTAGLTGGEHAITAAYLGDANYVSTTSAMNVEVYPAASAVTVGSSANPSTYGQPITLMATVTFYDGTSYVGSAMLGGASMIAPTGTMAFYGGGGYLGSASVIAGSASLPVSSLPVGYGYITANYSGDANVAGSSGSTSQTIQTATTTTIASSSPNPSTAGEPITLTATVSAVPPGGGTPTGTVDFYDSTTETDLGSVALSGGTVSLTTSNLEIGGHDLTATYDGDSNFAGSSDSAGQTVQLATITTTAVGSSLNPSALGQSVTFTATVAPRWGTFDGGGTVQFVVDGVNYGTPETLNNGQATIEDSVLALGIHTVTAIYSGDDNASGGSGALSGGQAVMPAATRQRDRHDRV